jgi:hypothetical protein
MCGLAGWWPLRCCCAFGFENKTPVGNGWIALLTCPWFAVYLHCAGRPHGVVFALPGVAFLCRVEAF